MGRSLLFLAVLGGYLLQDIRQTLISFTDFRMEHISYSNFKNISSKLLNDKILQYGLWYKNRMQIDTEIL